MSGVRVRVFSLKNLSVSDERSELKDFEEMTTSEVSIKGNCVNERGDSFSSDGSEPNDARNTMEIDHETPLYTELWHACAGPLVTVPRERERVFYFPQGHIEQVSLLPYLSSIFLLPFVLFLFLFGGTRAT